MIPFTKVQKQAKLVYNVRLVQGVEAGVEKGRAIHVCYSISVLFTRMFTLGEFIELHSYDLCAPTCIILNLNIQATKSLC